MLVKSQKGSALVMALLIGLLATVLGTALYSVSTANAKQVQQQSNQLQADYYAKSGVNLALGIIANHGGDYDGGEFWGTLAAGLLGEETDDYNIHIRITAYVDHYDIFSEGLVRGIGQSGGVSVAQSSATGQAYYRITREAVNDYNDNTPNGSGGSNSSGNGRAPSLNKIFAVGVNASGKAVTLTGSSCIYGDVGVNSIAPYCVDFSSGPTFIYDGNLYIGPNGVPDTAVYYPNSWRSFSAIIPDGTVKNLTAVQAFPLPTFPDFPSYSPIQSLTAGWWPIPEGGFRISQNGQYSDITVENQLFIDIGNEDRIIRTSSLHVPNNGHIILNKTGTGRLILYVDSELTLTGSSTINEGGDYNSLVVYYAGTDLIDVGGNTKFVGSIYAKSANVKINGSGGFTGHIITGGSEVNVQGDASANVRALYAPSASLKVLGSSKIKGAVVANDILVDGNSLITYDDSFSTDFFDLLQWPGSGNDNEETTPPVNTITSYGTWLKSI
jgi:hypothetical protein